VTTYPWARVATHARQLASIRSLRRKTDALHKDADALPYIGLNPYSLALDYLDLQSATSPQVVLVVPDARQNAMFAGTRTAIKAAVEAATLTGRPLRIVSFAALSSTERQRCSELVDSEFEFGQPLIIDDLRTVSNAPCSSGDIWIATYYTTAHCLQLLADRQRIDRSKVIYLIQDHEPTFFPASTSAALASATYQAGFVPLVNTNVLAQTLQKREGVDIPPQHVFSAELDYGRLAGTASRRDSAERDRILFYGRPAKPRNMFDLGLCALRLAARKIEDSGLGPVEFVSIGAKVPQSRLTTMSSLKSSGRLEWARYFDMLATGRVMLSLQATPHPSHPPLDMIVSGGHAVTNEIEGVRAGLHPRLHAVTADPTDLADAIVAALRESKSKGPGPYDDTIREKLGRPFQDAVASAVRATTP